ncbi:right-handed parallel beta-helix repeat-containing protein [Pelagicoccus mobilis]|uniref:Right-handed parallel beta-helix repeat-containing protein n=1 Tax=Pelagicoccus mobilis TaxID=415221 RepID=A0A934VPZ9_9BACT|nr:right-handed parallel beta-helix repeat-containing protein [Pelagicoccus mobilis]MBK1876053.1 right-handed parallel beta-helix repeat-containing protein [Pelagicoccus mobilis]
MKTIISSLRVAAAFALCASVHAEKIYYVSPSGSDSGSGAIDSPFASLTQARDQIRSLSAVERRQNIRVVLRGGRHSLRETFVLEVQDGAPLGLNVSYEAFPGEVPVLDSGVEITGWKKAKVYPEGTPDVAKGNLYVADIPEGVERFYSLWDEEDIIDRARAKFRTDPKLPMARGGVRTRWEERDLLRIKEGPFRNWENIGDIEIYKMPTRNWVANFLQLESVDLESKLARTSVEGTYKLSDNPPRKRANHDVEKEMVEGIGDLCNVPEGLTRPGTWIANTVEGKVYLWPESKTQLEQRIVAPTLAEYIRIDGENDEWGDNDVPVRGVTIKGLTFKHGKRLVLRKDSRGIQHDWEMFDEGNAFVRLRGAENCEVTDCSFLNSAGTGIRLDLYAQNNRIEGNLLDNLGYTGILLCGYGPGTKDVNHHNIVTNNEISRVGRLWFHALSIFVFQSGHNTISHNYIHDTMYDAIVVSGVRPRFFGYRFKDFPDFPTAYPNLREIMRIMRWDEIGGKPATFKGCLDYAHSRGNIIEYNEVEAVMGEGGDGNALYLSGTMGNTFRYNLVHSTAAGPGIFRNDDEQYESQFYGNILIGMQGGPYAGVNLKHENSFENNMVLNWGSSAVGKVTSLDPEHEKGSRGTSLNRNIFMHPDDNTLFIGKIDVHYGDGNVYYAAGDEEGTAKWLKRRQETGNDEASLAADPMFVDLENFNFRLKKGSPALRNGFEQIPFESIGLLSKPAVERLREEGKTFSDLLGRNDS